MKIKNLSAILCILLIITFGGCNKAQKVGVKPQADNKTYRNVKVIEVEGEATLTRDEKQQSVYNQMLIKGDDSITTDENSTVDLLLDSDKYARIFENSDVSFQLEGDTSKGAIRIYLNKVGINNKIENKLSENDSYEVHTPDAVMAVRGTEFEVITTFSDNKRQTKVTTMSGSVEITLLNTNGDKKLNEAGETTTIECETDSDDSKGNPKFKDEEPAATTSSKSDIVSSKTDTSSDKTTSGAPPVTAKPQVCPKCKTELEEGKTHLLSCAKEHYSCDGQNHTACTDCGKLMCDASAHTAFECNLHYPCNPNVFEGHTAIECGHYLCSITDGPEVIIHEPCVICKTFACKTDKAHTWAECGCVYCEGTLGPEHIMCEICYKCKSDGKIHEEGVCNIE